MTTRNPRRNRYEAETFANFVFGVLIYGGGIALAVAAIRFVLL